MPTFEYSAKDAEGNVQQGSVEAPDRFAVYELVRKEGSTVLSVHEKSARSLRTLFNVAWINEKLSRVKTADLIMLTRNLATMIGAGLTISRALSVMERQTQNPALKAVLVDLGERIKKGAAFHETLAQHPKVFSSLFVSMTRAGEEGGSLADSLRVVGEQMEKAYELKKKIRGALIYPTIIVVAMIGIGILMLIYVVPTLTGTFEELGVDLPLSTQIVISVSNFLVNNTLIALALMGAAVVGMIAAMRTQQGKRAFEYAILHIPIIKELVRETNAARTARTLSSLLSSGVEVVQALSITKDVVQNSYYKAVVAEGAERIQRGEPLSQTFIKHSQLYPVLMGEMVAVGEETGQISDLLSETAVFYENEISQKTKDMSTVIEPFLMLFIGAVVGFFAVSMIAPIYSLSSSGF